MKRPLAVNPVTVIWLFLVVLTGVSWWMGSGHVTEGTHDYRYTTAGLLALAFFKVRLVIMHFMEVRTAPWSLRLLFESWVVVVGLAVISIYWVGAVPP